MVTDMETFVWKNYRTTPTGYESLSRSYLKIRNIFQMNEENNKINLETIQDELQKAEKRVPLKINVEDDISPELGEDVVWFTEKERQLIEYDV